MEESNLERGSRWKDLTGLVFGRLTVLKFNSILVKKYGIQITKTSKWDCVCNCGNLVTITTSRLTTGNTKSCGCLHKEEVSKRTRKHGKSKTRAYKAWKAMITRCKLSKRYLEKNITVCDRWPDKENGFLNFLDDMGECQEELTLDRIDNNGNYEPSNCRWASHADQSFNKPNKRNTSGKTGVCFDKSTNKWQARINYKRKTYSLGQYLLKEDAIKAREAAEIKFYGFTR